MDADNGLATTNGSALSTAASHPRTLLTKQALEIETEQRKLLKQYVSENMVEDTDYGKIPGTQKPTLLKPGAEKLVDLFRCTPKFALLKCEEDFDKGFFNYIFRVRITQRDSGAVLAEGFGSANSREGRYRWRDAKRKCPKCEKETLFASKSAGEGFFCWSKKGGCGATFKPGDTSVTGQQLGKVENDDIATLANTILKMAKKRAYVDGAIALARCSDMFTQDVEDLAEPEPFTVPAPPSMAPPAQTRPIPQAQGATAPTSPPPAKRSTADVEAQVRSSRANTLWHKAKASGVSKEQFGAWCRSVLRHSRGSAEWTHDELNQLEACLPDLLRAEADVPH